MKKCEQIKNKNKEHQQQKLKQKKLSETAVDRQLTEVSKIQEVLIDECNMEVSIYCMGKDG